MRALLIAAAACLVLAAPASAASTTLVINDVDYDQPTADTAEFLEIKNDAEVPVEMQGASATVVVGSGAEQRTCALVMPGSDAESILTPASLHPSASSSRAT